ncbi:unnamed protein product [Durusdinium trenchii]|uniref:Uncharacterized protein n=2 Tax=Durusdinium trenchii TaxID=1381693 RepID=A0ABP0NTG9_9DINO
MVFSCTMGCSAHNLTAKEVKLALVHASLDGKRYSWYLTEFRDEDANSPIIYARTKLRKSPTYRVPWLTVTPGGDLKPKDLEEVHLITAWDALRFDTPLKWGVTVGAPQRVHARASECRFRGLARESEQSRSESLPMRAWRADRWVWSKVNGTEWNQKHDQVGMVIEPGKRGL